MALAGGVVLKALHQRPNFYSAAVYLAQSSANLMVRSQSLLRPSAAFPLISKNPDSDKPRIPDRMHVPPRPPEAPLWTPATHRDRTALRESVVRGH